MFARVLALCTGRSVVGTVSRAAADQEQRKVERDPLGARLHDSVPRLCVGPGPLHLLGPPVALLRLCLSDLGIPPARPAQVLPAKLDGHPAPKPGIGFVAFRHSRPRVEASWPSTVLSHAADGALAKCTANGPTRAAQRGVSRSHYPRRRLQRWLPAARTQASARALHPIPPTPRTP